MINIKNQTLRSLTRASSSSRSRWYNLSMSCTSLSCFALHSCCVVRRWLSSFWCTCLSSSSCRPKEELSSWAAVSCFSRSLLELSTSASLAVRSALTVLRFLTEPWRSSRDLCSSSLLRSWSSTRSFSLMFSSLIWTCKEIWFWASSSCRLKLSRASRSSSSKVTSCERASAISTSQRRTSSSRWARRSRASASCRRAPSACWLRTPSLSLLWRSQQINYTCKAIDFTDNGKCSKKLFLFRPRVGKSHPFFSVVSAFLL